MTPHKILVVDDDSAIRNLVHRFLEQHNFEMESAQNGKTALAVFEQFNPDLVILDVMLPDIIGYEVCQQMKQSRMDVLVMLLTSLTDVANHVKGLDLADAYVTKPFHLRVLHKQVEALLRLLKPPVYSEQQRCLVFEKLIIDPVHREVTLDNKQVSLTALEFDLLHCLAKPPQPVWRRQELLKQVWGYEFAGSESEERVVDVHIGQIRRKIERNRSNPSLIQTKRGVGYKFEPPNKFELPNKSWN